MRFQLGAQRKERADCLGAGMSLAYLGQAIDLAHRAVREKDNVALLSAVHAITDYAATVVLQLPGLARPAGEIEQGALSATPFVAHLRVPDEDEWRDLDDWLRKASGQWLDLEAMAREICAKSVSEHPKKRGASMGAWKEVWPEGRYQVTKIDRMNRQLGIRTPNGEFVFFMHPYFDGIIEADVPGGNTQIAYLLNLAEKQGRSEYEEIA